MKKQLYLVIMNNMKRTSWNFNLIQKLRKLIQNLTKLVKNNYNIKLISCFYYYNYNNILIIELQDYEQELEREKKKYQELE